MTVRVNPAGAVYSRFPANARVSLPRIAGHRDGDSTDCPGDALYGELPGDPPRAWRAWRRAPGAGDARAALPPAPSTGPPTRATPAGARPAPAGPGGRRRARGHPGVPRRDADRRRERPDPGAQRRPARRSRARADARPRLATDAEGHWSLPVRFRPRRSRDVAARALRRRAAGRAGSAPGRARRSPSRCPSAATLTAAGSSRAHASSSCASRDVSPCSGAVLTSSVGAGARLRPRVAGRVEGVVDPGQRPLARRRRRSPRASSGRGSLRPRRGGEAEERQPRGQSEQVGEVLVGLLLPAAGPDQLEMRRPGRAGERRRWTKGSGVCRRSNGRSPPASRARPRTARSRRRCPPSSETTPSMSTISRAWQPSASSVLSVFSSHTGWGVLCLRRPIRRGRSRAVKQPAAPPMDPPRTSPLSL